MMIVVCVVKKVAIACVAHFMEINNGKSITSKKQFMRELKSYMEMYGESCADDHQYEGSYCNEAVETVNKFYK